MLEVQSDTWYQIETYTMGGEPFSRTMFLTADLERALAKGRELKRYTKAELRIYSRLPLHSFNGYVLEPVERIFALPNGERIVCLESGLSLRDKGAHTDENQRFEEVKEIYAAGH